MTLLSDAHACVSLLPITWTASTKLQIGGALSGTVLLHNILRLTLHVPLGWLCLGAYCITLVLCAGQCLTKPES